MSVRMMMQGRKPAGGGSLITDSFNRADGPLGTTDTGQTWTVPSGSFSISSNQAASASSGGLAIVDAWADGSVSLDCWTSGSGPSGIVSSLVFRYSDTSNFWYVYDLSINGFLAIRKVQAGSDTQVASGTRTFGAGGFHNYEVVLSGTSIAVHRDGSGSPIVSTTSSFNQTAIGVGMRCSNGAGLANRWDNLEAMP